MRDCIFPNADQVLRHETSTPAIRQSQLHLHTPTPNSSRHRPVTPPPTMGAEAHDAADTSKPLHPHSANTKVEAVDTETGTLPNLTIHHNKKRTKKLQTSKKCCTWCGIPFLAMALTVLILSQTIFKFRDPDITLSNVHFSGVRVDYTRPLTPSSVNATLSANMNVFNPNHYTFKFRNSTIHVIYHGVMVGNISMPGGELHPGKAVALPALVTVGALKLGSSMGDLAVDFRKNELPFAMSVDIPGRVNVVHLFKHDVVLEYHCDVVFWVGNSTMKDYLCWKKVHL